MSEDKHVLTFEMAELYRNVKTLNLLAGFGSLWLVPECVWQQVMGGHPYDKNSNRKFHPGCSVLAEQATSPIVPVLHGTSIKCGGSVVAVADLTEPGRRTWFGGIPPRQIPFSFWMRASASGEKITPPPGRSFLSLAEMSSMRKLLLNMTSRWTGRNGL